MSSPFPYDGFGTYSPKAMSYSIARKQVSQGSSGELGLQIVGLGGELVDATDITVTISQDGDFDEISTPPQQIAQFSGSQITRDDLGMYHVNIGPGVTGERGHLAAKWTYEVAGVEFTYTDYLVITEPMPSYDALRPEEKTVVEQVSWMFADLFDSTNGGPNLTENFQTHFNYDRIAQLMRWAMIRINTVGIPTTNFGLGPGSTQLPETFHGLLTMGTYLETLLHLVRSYTEQPNLIGMTVTYTDRRDYAQRWKQMYDLEKPAYDKSLIMAKRKLLGLGRGSLLVAGGIYGSRGWFRSGTYAAQVRSMRFYPASSAIVRVG